MNKSTRDPFFFGSEDDEDAELSADGLSLGPTEGAAASAGGAGDGSEPDRTAAGVPPAAGLTGSGGADGAAAVLFGIAGGGADAPGFGGGLVKPPPGVMVVPVKMTPHCGHRVYGEFGVVVVPSDARHFSQVQV
jgi:hypothetical protein